MAILQVVGLFLLRLLLWFYVCGSLACYFVLCSKRRVGNLVVTIIIFRIYSVKIIYPPDSLVEINYGRFEFSHFPLKIPYWWHFWSFVKTSSSSATHLINSYSPTTTSDNSWKPLMVVDSLVGSWFWVLVMLSPLPILPAFGGAVSGVNLTFI